MYLVLCMRSCSKDDGGEVERESLSREIIFVSLLSRVETPIKMETNTNSVEKQLPHLILFSNLPRPSNPPSPPTQPAWQPTHFIQNLLPRNWIPDRQVGSLPTLRRNQGK